MQKKPNFFIIGAPKCGTTAFSEYLRAHPKIFMSTPKEPNYFCTDLFKSTRVYIRSHQKYLQLFDGAREFHRAVGEASVWYLYSKTAVRKIRDFNQEAKLIAMLRNPVDLVYSLHSTFLINQTENERDFQRAWALQAQRLKGISLPKGKEVALTQYGRIGMLGEQVERLLSIFPRDQVKIILFDDFSLSPANVYLEGLSFLGIPSDNRTEFPRINPNKEFKYKWLKPLTCSPPFSLSMFVGKVKSVLGIDGVGLRKSIMARNLRVTKRRPLSPEFKRVLQDFFKGDINHLSDLIDRDLRHWYAE